MIKHWACLMVMFASLAASSVKSVPAIPVHCCVVGKSYGNVTVYPHDSEDITNFVCEVNVILGQAAVKCVLQSVVFTNLDQYASLSSDDDQAVISLCSTLPSLDGLELYFVSALDGAAGLCTPYGIIIDSQTSARGVAHEIGHACGFDDIYVTADGTNLYVDCVVSTDTVSPGDWGRYSRNISQRDLIYRLLMYGYDGKDGVDIPFGNVFGITYDKYLDAATHTTNTIWRLGWVKVGTSNQINRSPCSQ